MDNRYSGYKRRTNNLSRTPATVRKSRNDKQASGLKLGICCILFLLTVLIKLLFPDVSDGVKNAFLPVIEGNTDYKSAFASMGRFFSGELSFDEAASDVIAFLFVGENAVKAGTVAEKSESTAQSGNSAVPSASPELPGQDTAKPVGEKSEPDTSFESAVYGQSDEKSTADSVPEENGDSNGQIITDNAPDETESIAIQEFETELEVYDDVPEDVTAQVVDLPFEYTHPASGEIASVFGYRMHPIAGETKFHYGLDFEGGEGDDIYAFADGYVAVRGESESAGYYIIISHGDGYTSHYFHCSKLIAEGGQWVNKGDKIAEIGSTGYTTGSHLHFELLFDGKYLNPGDYIG